MTLIPASMLPHSVRDSTVQIGNTGHNHTCCLDACHLILGLLACREQSAAVSDFAARVRAVKQWPGLAISASGRHPVWGISTGSNQQRRILLDNLLQVQALRFLMQTKQ